MKEKCRQKQKQKQAGTKEFQERKSEQGGRRLGSEDSSAL